MSVRVKYQIIWSNYSIIFKNWGIDTQMMDRIPNVFLVSTVTSLSFDAKNMSLIKLLPIKGSYELCFILFNVCVICILFKSVTAFLAYVLCHEKYPIRLLHPNVLNTGGKIPKQSKSYLLL